MDLLPVHWPNAVTVVDAATVELVDARAVRRVALDRGAVVETRDADGRLRGGWRIGAAEVRRQVGLGPGEVRWTGVAEEAAADGDVLWVRARGAIVRVAETTETLAAKGVVTLAASDGVAWVEQRALQVADRSGAVVCTIALGGTDAVSGLAMDARWIAVANAKGTLLVDRAACKVVSGVSDGAAELGFGADSLVASYPRAVRRYSLPDLAAGAWRPLEGLGLPDARDGQIRRAPTGLVAAEDVRALDDALIAFDPGKLRVIGLDGVERLAAEVPFRRLVSADAIGRTWVATDGNVVVAPGARWSLPGASQVVLVDPATAMAAIGDAWMRLDLRDPSVVAAVDDRPIQATGGAPAAYLSVPTTNRRWRLRKDGDGVRVVGRWDLRDRGGKLALAADSGMVSPDATLAVLRAGERLVAFEVATGRLLWEVAAPRGKAALDLYQGVVSLGATAWRADTGAVTTGGPVPWPILPAPAVGTVALDPAALAAEAARDDPGWCARRDELSTLLRGQDPLRAAWTAKLDRVCRVGAGGGVVPPRVLPIPPDAGGTCSGRLSVALSMPVQAGVPTLVLRAEKSPFPRWLGEVVSLVLISDKGARAPGYLPRTEVALDCVRVLAPGEALLVDGAGHMRGIGAPASVEGPALALALGVGQMSAAKPARLLSAADLGGHRVLSDGSLVGVAEGALVRWTVDQGLSWRIPARVGRLGEVGGLLLTEESGLTLARAIADGAVQWAIRGRLKGVDGPWVVVDDAGVTRVYDAKAPGQERWSASVDAIGTAVGSFVMGWSCPRVLSTGRIAECVVARAEVAAAAVLPEGMRLDSTTLTVRRDGRVVRTLRGVGFVEQIDARRALVAVGGPLGPRLVVEDSGAVTALYAEGSVLGVGGGVVWMRHGDDGLAAYRP